MEVINDMSANTVVLETDVDEVEPVGGVVDFFGEFSLAGHGVVTNDYCGKFASFLGCNRVELHNHRTLDGLDYSGKVYVKKIFNSCDKPSCPICFKYGWAVREAGKIEGRLVEASKQFGLVEHIIASVPVKDYSLSFEVLRRRVVDVLRIRGVVGGVLIFHRDRFSRAKGWYANPHFHVLGYILGGYGDCRGCSKSSFDCLSCSGFEARTRREFKKDGFIVKVLGKRKTVGGTAWYQLNHSSYKVGAKRSNVATWFGCCSYRKLKVTVEVKQKVCPICQHDLERLRYVGGKPDILDISGSSRSSCGKLDFFADAVENGRLAWVVEVKHGFSARYVE